MTRCCALLRVTYLDRKREVQRPNDALSPKRVTYSNMISWARRQLCCQSQLPLTRATYASVKVHGNKNRAGT